jgi:hypothetical protein
MPSRSVRSIALVATTALVIAACGSSDDDSAGESTTTQQPTTASSSTAPAPPPSTSSASPAAQGGVVEGDLTFTLAEGYTATWVGEGIKPDLELAPDGTPGITYLVEDLNGRIGYANAGTGWSTEKVVDGYFYGPIGLAYTPEGVPHIAFHDHQDTEFKQDKGDLTLAVGGASWEIGPLQDDGHDGWDSTIAIGSDGVVRAAGIDPQQFGSTDGVEYYEQTTDGDWEVTPIGSGAVAYEFNVSLAVDPAGNPALTYYDTATQTLQFAARSDGEWSIETVDADGDTGRYSSLTFDDAGTPHISYLRLDSASEGTVRYATRDGAGWVTSDVDTLTDLRTGFTGARRVTAIALDGNGRPHVVYSDEALVKRAVADAGTWTAETIVTAGDRALGQLVSFRLTNDGAVHLAVFEVTAASPLSGIVAYITTS